MSFSTTQSMSCLAYESAAELVFGRSRKPVACGFDLVIGAGQVFPEVNFTLPMISVEQATWSQVVAQYEEMATRILERAVALRVPGLVLEFELLPAMTETPEWGAEITRLLESHLHRAYEKHGLRCALRVTPTDIRDQGKPPLLRSSAHWETLRRSFELCIEAGAHLISIESIGGKELNDPGLMYGDIRAIVFALGVLAPRDTSWLWDQISFLCAQNGRAGRTVPSPAPTFATPTEPRRLRSGCPNPRAGRFPPETAPAVSPTRQCNWQTSICCRRCWRRWCGQ